MSVYQHQDAYIVATGAYLPGEPISNDEMEDYLGMVNDKPSRYRRRILQSNGIKSRHYAIDEKGEMTHLTDQLASEAIKDALISLGVEADTLDMFSVGTTLPDLLAPGIASMVHGRIGGKHADILSTAGICGAGAAAMKAAVMSVISGQHKQVVACGAERPSVLMRSKRFEKESEIVHEGDVAASYQFFHADFLRWMLSDGAGAFIIANAPRAAGLSLKVEWMETASYADALETCMYMGSSNPNALTPQNTWIENVSNNELADMSMLLLRQDTKVLAEHIVDVVADFAAKMKEKFGLPEIDWFLPHISSYFFHEKLHQKLLDNGIDIPLNNWFTNLETKGNTGAASIYIMLDELYRSGRLEHGQKLLLMIPESGRFSVSYALLTVVTK
ncbi:3-oxoacyl-[acyl-carrier-protein] synthase 3 protein 1 [Thalassocella blandensis]|nr:3-oxoacyl-[acyl-carrier-protein] synthase 3 protein 1 [Thalassocella blandensis]